MAGGAAAAVVGKADTEKATEEATKVMDNALGDALDAMGANIGSNLKDNFSPSELLGDLKTAALPGMVAAISDGVLAPFMGAVFSAVDTGIGAAGWFTANFTGQNNPVAQKMKLAITNMLTNFDKQVAGSASDQSSLSALLTTIQKSLNNLVGPAEGFATGLTALLDAINPVISDPQTKQLFNMLSSDIAKNGKQAGPILADFMTGLLQLLVTAEPLVTETGQMLQSIMSEFASNKAGTDESKFFQEWANQMKANSPLIKEAFDALINLLTAAMNDLKPLEQISLTAISGTLQAAANVLNALKPVFSGMASLVDSVIGSKGAGGEIGSVATMTVMVAAFKTFFGGLGSLTESLAKSGLKSISTLAVNNIGYLVQQLGVLASKSGALQAVGTALENIGGKLLGIGGKSGLESTVAKMTVAEMTVAEMNSVGGTGGLAKDVETGMEDAAPLAARSTAAAIGGIAGIAALVTLPADMVLLLGAVTRTNPESKTNVAGHSPTGLYGTKSQQSAYELP